MTATRRRRRFAARFAARFAVPFSALVAAAGFGACAPVFAATPTYRIEVHPFASLTLSTAQLLAGTTEGAAAATIAGELRLPASAAPKMPAVVMLHGDAGAIANQVIWIEDLNAIGIAVFTLDSFSGRDAVSPDDRVTSMPDSVDGGARVVDAERALALLAKHPRIDPARIAVMGFSSGGRAALVAAQTRFASAYGTPGLRFAAYIAFYPPCNIKLVGDTAVEPGPLRIFHGADDRVTSADACRRYVERLRAAGADATLTTYPGAYHGFDNVSNPDLIRMPEAPMAARCNVEEASGATIVNVDTGKPLAPGDACFSKGFVAGYDAAANTAARADVKAFLIEAFKLKR